MGLDMYLTRRSKKTAEQEELVMYWRKENHIHAWLEDRIANGYIENCVKYPVSKDDLNDLISDCEHVLAHREDASAILPREEGFFFGSQEYDDWYFEGLKDTVELARQVIDATSDDDELFYHAWW